MLSDSEIQDIIYRALLDGRITTMPNVFNPIPKMLISNRDNIPKGLDEYLLEAHGDLVVDSTYRNRKKAWERYTTTTQFLPGARGGKS